MANGLPYSAPEQQNAFLYVGVVSITLLVSEPVPHAVQKRSSGASRRRRERYPSRVCSSSPT